MSDSIDGVKELEITVSDFYKTNTLLKELGYQPITYQENRRTSFKKKGGSLEVCIDEWPKIPPYLEIEGRNTEAVKSLLDVLDVGHLTQTSAPTSEVYGRYGLTLADFKNLSF